MISSDLDAINGLGKSKQEALRKHFGSMKKIRTATLEQLMEVPGVGEKLATSIKESLEDTSRAGVNMTTGEIVD
jgi:excinuclease ABC subunit C